MSSLIKLKKLTRQGGDTIVEVMIVLAVLGFAISISYATANRSLLNARQAQENSQASEIVQAQFENLRTLTSAGIFRAAPFCLNTSNVIINYSVAGCVYTPNPLYTLQISFAGTVAPSPNAGGTFTVVATWPDVEGQGNDTVRTSYRLYAP